MAGQKLDGRVLEDPAFPNSSVFDVIGAEFSLGARPAQWLTADDLTAELDADSASASLAGEAPVAAENRASAAAGSVVERAADSGPTDAGGLFGEA
ncbi:MAG: hypothetical protein ACKPHU_00080, partial [Planctomycetaceae bacterium]